MDKWISDLKIVTKKRCEIEIVNIKHTKSKLDIWRETWFVERNKMLNLI